MSSSDPSKDSNPPNKLPHEELFDSIRRFTDQHISSVLHSLIGLPSMLTPPAPGAWIMDDESSDTSGTSRQRSLSEGSSSTAVSTVEEVRNLKNGEGKGSSGGIAISGGGSRGEMERGGPSKNLKSIWGGEAFQLERMFGDSDLGQCLWPWQVWSEGWERDPWRMFGFEGVRMFREEMERMEKELQREFSKAELPSGQAGDEKQKQLPPPETAEENNEETELDAYNVVAPSRPSRFFFSSSSTVANVWRESPSGGKPGVISEMMSKQSYTGLDGITRTKYVLKKRFADGTEENVEQVYSNAPRERPERFQLVRGNGNGERGQGW